MAVTNAFRRLDNLVRHPDGFTIDQIDELDELFLKLDPSIQLCWLRADRPD